MKIKLNIEIFVEEKQLLEVLEELSSNEKLMELGKRIINEFTFQLDTVSKK
jgi:hypothetical protein